MTAGAVESHGPGMAEGTIVFGVGRRSVVHDRRTVIGTSSVASGTIEAGFGNPLMTGRTLIVNGRGGDMMHFRRAVLHRLCPVATFAGAGQGSSGGAGMALATDQPVPRGGGVMPLGDSHGIGVFVASGAADGGEGHAVVAGVAILRGKGGILVMHGGGAVSRLALMAGGAIQTAGDPFDPLMAGTAIIVDGRSGGMVHRG